MKFGDGPVDSLSLLEPADHSSSVVFVQYDKAFLKQLMKNDKLIIELPFYQAGRKQFEFDVGGLKQ